MKNSKKIWLYVDVKSKDISKYIRYNGDKIISPNLVLVAISKILTITTNGVGVKNYCKIQTARSVFYADKSLVQIVKILNDDDIKQVSKNCFVRISKINKRLSTNYLFLKGLKQYIKVGEMYQEKLKQYLKL